MEFKGTKGKWKSTNGYTVWSKVGNNTKTIADCENRNLKGSEEFYNALLISKAPEMLELLNELVNLKGCVNLQLQDKARKLIKESTEL